MEIGFCACFDYIRLERSWGRGARQIAGGTQSMKRRVLSAGKGEFAACQVPAQVELGAGVGPNAVLWFCLGEGDPRPTRY